MDYNYCIENCLIGKKKSEELLDGCNSACDAAIDFRLFADDCFKTCPYRDEPHKDNFKTNES